MLIIPESYQFFCLFLTSLKPGKSHLELVVLDRTQSLNTDAVETNIGYFENQQDRMKYDQYRIAGYPIGSGSVETGINGVVHHRMKRQGQGWARDNVNPMLAALSELHSDRFLQEWKSTQ